MWAMDWKMTNGPGWKLLAIRGSGLKQPLLLESVNSSHLNKWAGDVCKSCDRCQRPLTLKMLRLCRVFKTLLDHWNLVWKILVLEWLTLKDTIVDLNNQPVANNWCKGEPILFSWFIKETMVKKMLVLKVHGLNHQCQQRKVVGEAVWEMVCTVWVDSMCDTVAKT